MRTDQPRINIRRAALIFVAGIITASCSEKPAPDREKNVNASDAPREMVRESEVETAEGGDEPQPGKDEIEEDCAVLLPFGYGNYRAVLPAVVRSNRETGLSGASTS